VWSPLSQLDYTESYLAAAATTQCSWCCIPGEVLPSGVTLFFGQDSCNLGFLAHINLICALVLINMMIWLLLLPYPHYSNIKSILLVHAVSICRPVSLCRSSVHRQQPPVESYLTAFHSHLTRTTLLTVPPFTHICITHTKHAHVSLVHHHLPQRHSQRPAVQVTLLYNVCMFLFFPFSKFPFRCFSAPW